MALFSSLLLAAKLLMFAQADEYSVWDRLAWCESRGTWDIETGNGYSGGLQMDPTFWRVHGGTVYAARPSWASRETQIEIAINGRDGLVGYPQGYRAWPTCARILGLI